MKKKFLKLFSVLVILIIAFSSLAFSVSAATEDSKGYYFNIQQPVANSNSGYIELLTENWGPMLVYFNASFQHSFGDNNVNDGAFNFFAVVEDNRLIIRNQGNFGAVDGFDDTQYVDIWGFYVTLEGVTGWRSSSYGTESIYPYNTFNIGLENCGAIIRARGYNCNLDALGIVHNYFQPFVYGSDTALYNQMRTIEEYLKQNISGNQSIIDDADKNASQIQSNADKNASQIQSNADKNASQIQSNSDKNASQIQSNADKNASQIQQNQDKNTDKVVNGWEQKDEIDTTVTDDYAVKDKELMDSTEQGRSSAVSVFNSFGSLFQSDGHLYKGLLAVSAVFTEFMKIDWLSSLLNFSLAIGIFAFVIGTGSQVFRSAHEEYKEEKIDKIDSYDERWLM